MSRCRTRIVNRNSPRASRTCHRNCRCNNLVASTRQVTAIYRRGCNPPAKAGAPRSTEGDTDLTSSSAGHDRFAGRSQLFSVSFEIEVPRRPSRVLTSIKVPLQSGRRDKIDDIISNGIKIAGPIRTRSPNPGQILPVS